MPSKGMADHEIRVDVEAKLLVPTTADLRAISRLTHLGRYPLQPRGTVRLHSSYLDTPTLALARHGVAVRLRRQGRQWDATLEWTGQGDGDAHERPELTIALLRRPALPFLPPPGPLQAQLAALVAGRPLTPILMSEIHRRLFDVLPSEPAVPLAAPLTPIAELALDRVRVRAPQNGQAESTYCAVACRRGDRHDIASLARGLRRGFGLLPSHESTFAHGLTLLYGRIGGRRGGQIRQVPGLRVRNHAGVRIVRELHKGRVVLLDRSHRRHELDSEDQIAQ